MISKTERPRGGTAPGFLLKNPLDLVCFGNVAAVLLHADDETMLAVVMSGAELREARKA